MSTLLSLFPTLLATSSKRSVQPSPLRLVLSPRLTSSLLVSPAPTHPNPPSTSRRSSNTATTTNPTLSPSPRILLPTWPRKPGGGPARSESGTPSSSRSIRRCFSRSSWLRIIWISSLCCESSRSLPSISCYASGSDERYRDYPG